MGAVVGAEDGRAQQVADGRTTLANAQARGGQVKEDAEATLGPVLALYDASEAEATSLALRATAARARRGVANEAADEVVVEELDRLYVAGGRTRNDPILAIAAPNGATPIIRAGLDEQPVRMRLVAKVLAKVKHPRIEPAVLSEASARIAAAADPLAVAVRETADVIVEADMADEALTALARLVRVELMALKRLWLGRRMSESEVHDIIPDRPAAKPKPKEDPK